MTSSLVLVGLAPACERLAPPPAHQRQAGQEPQAESPAAPLGAASPGEVEAEGVEALTPGEIPAQGYRFPAPERLVAIGDIHGDIQAMRAALRLAGAIDESDRWIGGELVVVQTGDQLDRGDDEQEILELLARIQREAAEAGGGIHILNGNHEFMNALGDLRYVTRMGFADFEDAPGVDPDQAELTPIMSQVPEHARARVAAFWPGQPWALELAKRNTIVLVGDSVFVHGGVLPSYAREVEAINADARAWLAGKRDKPPKAIVAPDGPVWSRHYSDSPGAEECAMLDETLELLGVKRMVVGHTVHKEGVSSACEDKVWMIDVGMAAYYGGPVQVLEIRDGKVEVLS